jgi:hypothetical protein
MSKSTTGWFGVFSNVVAAQDWKIKRQTIKTDISVTQSATGGLGDMFFMIAPTANGVV